MIETWKPIKGFEGHYEVSSIGRIKSMKSTQGRIPGTILKTLVGTQGYLCILLYKNASDKYFRVHKLVSEAFLGERPKGSVVNHRDGNKLNNEIDNLEFTTQSENFKHAVRIGLMPPSGEYRSNLMHCMHGHPFDERNTIYTKNYRNPSGKRWRQCRKCNRNRDKKYRVACRVVVECATSIGDRHGP